jgi:hypothetical protein
VDWTEKSTIFPAGKGCLGIDKRFGCDKINNIKTTLGAAYNKQKRRYGHPNKKEGI